jgi:hypothetical protein
MHLVKLCLGGSCRQSLGNCPCWYDFVGEGSDCEKEGDQEIYDKLKKLCGKQNFTDREDEFRGEVRRVKYGK